jgi:hypothetical protein
VNKDTSKLIFFQTSDDLVWDPPSMENFARSLTMQTFQEQGETLLTFFDTLQYFEKFIETYRPSEKTVPRTDAWIDSLQEAIPGLYVQDSFWPLDVLALCSHLEALGPRYPRRLIAFIEYVLADWDANLYMSSLKKIHWPKFLRAEVESLTTAAKSWLAELTYDDVFEHNENE